jgi:hypothetical protein
MEVFAQKGFRNNKVINKLDSILAWCLFTSFLVLAPTTKANNTNNTNNNYYTRQVCHPLRHRSWVSLQRWHLL